MHRLPRELSLPLAAVGVLLASASAMGSEVNYSACPAYPFGGCPAGSVGLIPDNNANGVNFVLNVPSDGENFITDVQPWFFISHTYQGDLRVVLTSPDGTSVELINRPGAPTCNGGFGFDANDFGFADSVEPYCAQFVCRFTLSDSAATTYNPPTVPCPGISGVSASYRPVSPLSAFDGQSKVGIWTLSVQDLVFDDDGAVILWGVTIRTEPATSPITDIALPDDFACACNGGAITGSAFDPDGTLTNYRLEWSADSAGPWNLITSSSTPVNGGTLGFVPGAMPEGYAYLRLIATNDMGLSSTFSKVIYPDDAFSGAGFVEPQDGDIVGGAVCMDRVSASDHCFASAALAYAPQGGGFNTFFSTTTPPSEFPPWNTGGLPDGNYTLRVTGTTTCGNSASDTVAVVVDNTAPVATIASPANCAQVSGSVPITGTVTDAHLGGWVLQYTGGAIHGWQTIASGSGPVVGGLLANWNTAGLPSCAYTLRLLASDASTVSCLGSNSTEYLVSVELGGGGSDCVGDLNGDGVVTIADLALFLANFGAVCP